MKVYDHLVGVSDLGEVQNLRLHNVASLGSPSASAKGLTRYLTVDDRLYLHVGSSVWKRFVLDGDPMTTLALANNKILVGNVSGLATEVLKSAVPFSDFGAATANVGLGGFKITGSGVVTSADSDSTLATVGYVNAVAQGLDAKDSCLIASNTAFTATYSTVSLTLTASSNGALTATALDSGASGSTLLVGSRILMRSQATSEHNGIYVVQDLGSAGTPAILVRSVDANINGELDSAFTFIEEGSYANTGWVQTSDTYDITSPGSGSISWTQFSGAGSYAAGRGMILSGNTFHFAKTTAYAQGDLFYGTTTGSGDSATSKVEILTIGSSGKLLQSNGSNPTWSTAGLPTGAAANQALLKGDGTNWTSLSVTTNNVLVSTSGTVQWSNALPSGTTLAGNTIYSATGTDVAMADGGTGATLTPAAGAIVYSGGSALALSAVGTSGQFSRSGGAGAPTWYDLFGSANTWTALNTFQAAGISALAAFKLTASSNNHLEIKSDGSLAWGSGSGTPALTLAPISSSEMRAQFNLGFLNIAGTTTGILLYDADNSAYISLKAPNVATTKAWVLPDSDVANGVWTSDGSGNLSCGLVSAASVGGGAALTRVNDTNVTLTLGGSPGSALLLATSLTLGWTGTLAVSRGGTGQGSNLTQYGLVFATTTTAMASTAAPTLVGQVLRGNTAGTPTWSPYTLPASFSAAGQLLFASTATAVTGLAITVGRILTSISGAPAWDGIVNPSRNTSNGIARKWSNQVTGDNSNAFITVTHNLATKDVNVSVRDSNSGDTGAQEIGITKITVDNTNSITIYFNSVQTSSNFYVVTVIG